MSSRLVRWVYATVTSAVVALVAMLCMTSGQAQSNGAAALFAFSEGNGVATADRSGNTNGATLVGGTSWTVGGRFGAALLFDGVDDAVELPVTPSLALASSFTLEAWVRPTAGGSTNRQIIQVPGSGGDGLKLTPDRRPRFAMTLPGGNVDVTSPSPIEPDRWTHLGVSYDGVMLRLYIDAVEIATMPATGGMSGLQSMFIGRARGGGGPFSGAIDEVRIYQRTLTAIELALDRITPIDGSHPFDVAEVTPSAGASAVIAAPITASFTRPVNVATITGATFVLRDGSNSAVSATVSYDAAARTAVLTPSAALLPLTTYTVGIVGGEDGPADTSGATLDADEEWWFTTAADDSVPSAAFAFSEGDGFVTADSSGNGHTATLVDGPEWTTGQFGSGLQFDGLDDGVRFAPTDAVRVAAAFTIEAWVQPFVTGDDAHQIVQTAGDSGDGLKLTANGRPRFTATFPGGSVTITGPAVVTPFAWTHVAVSYDGTALRLYVNGVGTAIQAVTGSLVGWQSLWIGRTRNGGNPFTGLIDEVRIYRRARNASEIAVDAATPIDSSTPFQVSASTPRTGAVGVLDAPVSVTFSRAIDEGTLTSSTFTLVDAAATAIQATLNYDATTRTATLMPDAPLADSASFTVRVAGGSTGVLDAVGTALAADSEWFFQTAAGAVVPSAAYALDEGGGPEAFDATGNGHTGTLTNDPVWIGGQYGGALGFDGVDDGVALPASDALTFTSAVTIEAWVQPLTEAAVKGRQIVQLPGAGGDGLRLTADGRPRFRAMFPGGRANVTGPVPLTANAWTHVAATYDGAMLRMYVGGIEVAARAVSGDLSGALPMFVGRTRLGGAPFPGGIDEVRIYRRVLTAEEITADMNTPINEPVAHPVSLTVTPIGVSIITSESYRFSATATFSDGTTSDMTAEAVWTSSNETVATVTSGVAMGTGAGRATVTATLGSLVATGEIQVNDGVVLPPDPRWFAPPVDATVSTRVADSTLFLYSGANRVQYDAESSAFDPGRAGVLRGQVTTRDGAPLPAVTVTIAGHPEYGYSLSRADGMFDLAVNGGATLTIQYQKAGYLPADRTVDAARGDYVSPANVALVPLDAQVTTIAANSGAMQRAQGTPVTDEDGTRQATVLFPAGVAATMVMPDGTTQPLATLHVRATEYTVGPNGQAAMPAPLPEASAYTYAVELGVDEAIQAGATAVTFTAPLPLYVQNFLGFPVGLTVPVGYYDRTLKEWVAAPNGVVIKVLTTDVLGRAEIDINGDDQPEDAAALAALGFTDAERSMVASTYPSGQTLWRAQVTHFTPYDLNWAYMLPSDYRSGSMVDANLAQPRIDHNSASECLSSGSIVECQDQVLGERLPIDGTPFTLNYRSDRVPGRQASRAPRIPITEPTSPASLKRVERVISIGGRQFKDEYPATGGQEPIFVWDGLDAYGRRLQGFQQADIEIRHFYDATYTAPTFSLNAGPVFGRTDPNPTGVSLRFEFATVIRRKILLGGPAQRSFSAAGWSLDAHQVYDLASRTLFQGDGTRRTVGTLEGIRTVADLPSAGNLTFDSAGNLYFVQFMSNPSNNNWAVRKLTPTGQISTRAALRQYPKGLVVDDDGTMYYARYVDDVFTCASGGAESVMAIRRAPDGTETVIASATLPAASGCQAVLATLTRSPEGVMYLVSGRYIYQVQGASLQLIGQHTIDPWAAAAGPGGKLYLGAYDEQVIDLFEGGQFTRFAGTGTGGSSGDGGPAVSADIGSISLGNLRVGPDGSVLFIETNPDDSRVRVRRVGTDGMIATVAGGATYGDPPAGDGSAPSALKQIEGVGVSADGKLYASDVARLYELRPEFKGDPNVGWRVVAADGNELYEFDRAGRHIRTRHTVTGAVLYSLTYDAEGLLTEIRDGDGLVTRVERQGNGAPIAIVAPFGQRTTLTVDDEGWLSTIVAPGGRTTRLTTTGQGLLTQLVDVSARHHDFTYDAEGRLSMDHDPAGGSQALARTALADGWRATRTTGLGRVRAYETHVAQDGTQDLTVTEADGTQAVTTRQLDGAVDSRAPNGLRTVTTMTADPRFGMQAPMTQTVSITTPGGLTLSTAATRTVTLADSSDVASVKTITETATLNGRTTQTVFDAATRTYTTTTPSGRVSSSTIDPQGRVTHTQVGSLTPVDFTYDAQGRLTTITQGARQSTIAYDGSGRPATLTDASGRAVGFGYDAAERVATQTLPDDRQIGFGYDAAGNVTALTPPGRPAHTFSYTPVDLTSSYTPPPVPGTGPTGYTFNSDQQPTAVQRPDGQTTAFGYDSGGRLSTVAFSRGGLQYAYDTAGRVRTLADPGGVGLTFTYDGPLPLTETWSGPVAGTVARTFTSDFVLATEQVAGSAVIAFGYDADQLLTQAGALTIARDPATGLVTGTTLGTTTDAVQYNALGEPTHQTAQVQGTTVFDVGITRDDLGRISQRIETVDGITRVFAYGYDLAGRLSQVTRNGTAVVARYFYDDNGNRLEVQGEGGSVASTYDAQDRLLTSGDASYTYTANGELATKMVGGQTTGYVYDTLGNLTQVTLPTGDVISYTVDGRGRRVGKSVNGVRVKGWLYADQVRPIAELDGEGNVVSRFVYGAKSNVPEYVIKNGETYRVFSDHLGTPRVVVHAATGAVVQRLDVQPFGAIIQDSAPGWQPFGFAGGLYDPDTGLVRFGVRDYDPQTGRWTAKDPIGFDGGDSQLYGYVLEDPVDNIDPTGDFGITAYAEIAKQGLIGAGQGLAASIDGAIPFFNPLEASGLYDAQCFGLTFSRIVGGASLETLLTYGGLRALASYSARSARGTRAYLLNHNRYIRIGLGKTRGYKGIETPRISIGGKSDSSWTHFSLTFFGY